MQETTSAQVAVLEAFFGAVARFDFDAAFAHLADTCRYQNMPTPSMVLTGPVAARRFLEAFFSPTVENEFLLLKTVEDGPVVISERLDRHKLKDGRWVELPVTGVFEFKDGKIVAWRDYFDAQTITSQWPAAGAVTSG